MPTINELPTASTVTASDSLPISQHGVARSISIGSLLATTQPAIQAPTGMLLGRLSLGSGGPEPIGVGAGLALSAGTLHASAANFSNSPTMTALTANQNIVSADGSGNPALLPVSQLRGLFAAGANISINASGTISASSPSTATSFNIGALPVATAVASTDLIPIRQSGTDHSVSYASLLNGLTIDAAQPASAVSDSDSFWVAQNSNVMVAQTFGAVWPWVQSKLPSYKLPVVEISTNTALDGTVHNNRILVCSQPVQLTPLTTNMGSGFRCEILNLSNGNITFGGSIQSSSGTNVLASGQYASVRCITYSAGTIVHVVMGGSGTSLSVPGAISNLASTGQTQSTITISWAAPAAGGVPSAYNIQYRITGSSVWSVQSVPASPTTVTGLAANTSYDIAVAAANAVGSGPLSTVLAIATQPAVAVPSAPINLTASGPTTSSIQLSWQAPSTGGAASSYTVQYRVSGTTTWSNSVPNVVGTTQTISGLAATTSYDFAVFGVNAAGSGALSSVATAATSTPVGAVTSITWNLAPSGSFAHGSGSIGVNAHVSPSSAAIQFGFSNSVTVKPTSWTNGVQVNTDLWGAYVSTPATAGTYFAWAQGTDGSAPTAYATPFTVT